MKIMLLITLFSLFSFAESDLIGIDVRSWPERKLNPAPSSLAISTGDLEEELREKKVEKDQEIVVFCEAGVRAEKAKKVLKKLGYTKVKNIGSWREWNRDYAKNRDKTD
jgi:rhodanese-related sulfurtransferase